MYGITVETCYSLVQFVIVSPLWKVLLILFFFHGLKFAAMLCRVWVGGGTVGTQDVDVWCTACMEPPFTWDGHVGALFKSMYTVWVEGKASVS